MEGQVRVETNQRVSACIVSYVDQKLHILTGSLTSETIDGHQYVCIIKCVICANHGTHDLHIME